MPQALREGIRKEHVSLPAPKQKPIFWSISSFRSSPGDVVRCFVMQKQSVKIVAIAWVQVVRLLTDMKSRLETEAKADAELYDQLACWSNAGRTAESKPIA